MIVSLWLLLLCINAGIITYWLIVKSGYKKSTTGISYRLGFRLPYVSEILIDNIAPILNTIPVLFATLLAFPKNKKVVK